MATGPHKDDINDLFAGRVYGKIMWENQSRAAMRRLMSKRPLPTDLHQPDPATA
jgi:hypothetical protein